MYDSTRHTWTCPHCHQTGPITDCILIERGYLRFWSLTLHPQRTGLLPCDDHYSTSGDDHYDLECPGCGHYAQITASYLQWDDAAVPDRPEHPSTPAACNAAEHVPSSDDHATPSPIRRLPTVLELNEREPHLHQAGAVLQAILARVYARSAFGDTSPTFDTPPWLLAILEQVELLYDSWPPANDDEDDDDDVPSPRTHLAITASQQPQTMPAPLRDTVTYEGFRNSIGVHVIVSTTETSQPLRHAIRHSPTGFSWGYAGSGPADLARSILAHHLGGIVPSPSVYQAFKSRIVAAWTAPTWHLTTKDLVEALTTILQEQDMRCPLCDDTGILRSDQFLDARDARTVTACPCGAQCP